MARPAHNYSEVELKHRTTLQLQPELWGYLYDLSARCKMAGGAYLDRSQILRAAIRTLRTLEKQIDLDGVKDEKDLTERFCRAFKKASKR